MPATSQPSLHLPHCFCCQQPAPPGGAVSEQPLLLEVLVADAEAEAEAEAEAPDCWLQRPQVAAQ